jgi:hypothetical protein
MSSSSHTLATIRPDRFTIIHRFAVRGLLTYLKRELGCKTTRLAHLLQLLLLLTCDHGLDATHISLDSANLRAKDSGKATDAGGTLLGRLALAGPLKLSRSLGT